MSVVSCAEIVRQGDPDRFLATMAAPVAARATLFPLYAFNVEVARAPWVSAEPMIGEMRLQWWRDVLEEVEKGARPRAHEVAAPLAAIPGLETGVLDRLVAAHRVTLDPEGFADAAHFESFIEATGAGLMWAAAKALGTPPEAEAQVRAIGWAAGLAAYLRAVPEQEARGKRPLPDGRAKAVKSWAETGLERLKAGQGRAHKLAHPALLAAWRAEATLRRAATDPGRVAAGALEESDFARRAGLLRRATFRGW